MKKYYILNRSVADAKRFKREHKKYIPYGSLRHKLIFLNASIVFATHENQVSHNSIKWEGTYLKDLFDYTTFFIQHGLTVQNLPHILNRFVDNTKRYFIASPYEQKNLLQPVYGYIQSNIIHSGLPRYDGLKSRSRKQIIITPTWRSYLANPGTGRGEAREKNELFKESVYFEIYNSLINNKKLLDTAEDLGYEIAFLLHPVTSSQLHDFDECDTRVRVIAATTDTSYEQILTESSLMVTDYSGVQFDFAYMKKPILYYHPKDLPSSYEEAIYNYNADALGEIFHTSKDLINRICVYMQNDCQLSEQDERKMDEFFFHKDHANAKRIYNEAKKFQKNPKERVDEIHSDTIEKYIATVSASKYVRHALGGADGHMYLNSIDVMKSWYDQGDRIFEADINYSSDNSLVLFHTYSGQDKEYYARNEGLTEVNGRVEISSFKRHKMFGTYRHATFADLVDFMRLHRDAYVMIDVGRLSYDQTQKVYKKIIEDASNDNDVLQRLIVGGHSTEAVRAVKDIYPFCIYNILWSDDKRREGHIYSPTDFAKYCEANGITSVSIPLSRYTNNLTSELSSTYKSLITYVFTTDDNVTYKDIEDASSKFSAVGTNFLSSH